MPNYSSLLAYKWSDGDFTYSLDPSNSAFHLILSDVDNPDWGNSGFAMAAMTAWAAVADINFTLDNDDPEIGFYEAEISTPGKLGHTAFISTGVIPSGQFASDVDVYVNDNDTVFGAGEKAFTYLHELGHALGLQHPNDDPNDAEYDHRMTVMSYEPWTAFPTTPMIFDIRAMQEMYGANWNYNNGSTSYTVTSDSKLWTIWDAGGSDTLDASNLALNIMVKIDLREGVDDLIDTLYFSQAGDNLIYLAYGANIENAKGNDGDNYIDGNSAKTNASDLANDPYGASYTAGNNLLQGFGGSDHLFGHGGNDTLEGGTGADFLEGGAGADSLDGGDGIDTVSYEESSVGVTINVFSGYANGGDATGDTLTSIENVTGSNFADFLSGTGSSDTLAGLAGNDYLYGGAGADSLDGGADSDTVSYNTSSAAVSVNLTTGTNTDGDAAGDVLTSIEMIEGSSYNDTLTGSSGSDTLSGGLGNDILDGGAAADFLSGYDGDDIFRLNNNNPPYGDFISAGNGNDTIYADTDVIFSGSNVLAQVSDDDRHITIKLHAQGASFAAVPVITSGTSSADRYVSISSGGGLNTLNISAVSKASGIYIGGQSIVLFGLASGLHIGNGSNELSTFLLRNNLLTVSADGSTYTINFGSITTGTSASEIFNTSTNQVIVGGGGADYFAVYTNVSYSSTIDDFTLAQGDAIDITRFDGVVTQLSDMSAMNDYGATKLSIGSQATLYLNGTTAASVTAAYFLSNTLDYGAGVTEYGSSTADTITGSSGNDAYYANEGNDSVNGYTGNDTLWGWTGNDTLYGSYGNDSIGGDQDNDLLYGDGGNDTIDGGDGNDIIFGGAGADSLGGGNGIDTLNYLGAGSAIAVSLATGLGSAGEANGDTLAGFENVIGTIYNDAITGSSGSNSIDGGDGNDTIVGGAGADSLSGGNGTDVLSYAGAAAAIAVSLAAGTGSAGEANGDTVAGFENVVGSSYNDTITGDIGTNSIEGGAGNDSLNGGDGNDTIMGGTGADSLNGGNGTDYLSYQSATASISVNLTTGFGGVGEASGDTVAGFEHVTGSSYNDTIIGNTGNNWIFGGDGNDSLSGGSGSDQIQGGYGNNYLDGGSGSDQLSYAFANAGINLNLTTSTATGTGINDTIASASFEFFVDTAYADTITGGSAGENVTLSGGNDSFDGGGGADTLLLNAYANDTLEGGSGVDTLGVNAALGAFNLDMQTGIFSYSGGTMQVTGFERILGTSSNDTMTGSTGDDLLSGNQGNDSLVGGGGTDTLAGATGNDTLTGGTGDDLFQFNGNFGSDTITDFQGAGVAGGDTIQIIGGSYAALSFSQSGSDAVITSSTNTITLIGVNASSLTSADFAFS